MKRIILLFLLILLLLFSGCGDISAPPDATIEIQPSSVSYTGLSGDVCRSFTISVKNKDGIGLSDVEVYVSGSMAYPRDPARYYFYDNSNCSGQYKSSSMRLVTGDFGVAYFSISIPAKVNNNVNVFKDTIEVRSGVLYTPAEVSVSE